MELLTGSLRATLLKAYHDNASNRPDPMILVKFFCPWSSWTWYAIDFDGNDTLFCLVDGFELELGPVSLSELESIRGKGGLRIERDLHFRPKRLSVIREKLAEKRFLSE